MEKRVAPILVIVVLFIALLSTYAWFSDSMSSYLIIDMESGTPTVVVLGTGEESKIDYQIGDLNVDPYRGQDGFDKDGNAYGAEEADYLYSIDVNFPYKAQSAADAKFYVSIERVVIELSASYTKNLDTTLSDVIGVTIIDGNYSNYVSYDIDSYPSGEGASSFYVVCDNETNKNVTHIVIGKAYVPIYFEFDYWKSGETKIIRKGTGYTSALSSGVELEYGTDVTNAGTLNYVGLYVGFCGYNSESKTYNKTFAFSDTCYQGATFLFYLAAEIQ